MTVSCLRRISDQVGFLAQEASLLASECQRWGVELSEATRPLLRSGGFRQHFQKRVLRRTSVLTLPAPSSPTFPREWSSPRRSGLLRPPASTLEVGCQGQTHPCEPRSQGERQECTVSCGCQRRKELETQNGWKYSYWGTFKPSTHPEVMHFSVVGSYLENFPDCNFIWYFPLAWNIVHMNN